MVLGKVRAFEGPVEGTSKIDAFFYPNYGNDQSERMLSDTLQRLQQSEPWAMWGCGWKLP